jgi:hypothetical protein
MVDARLTHEPYAEISTARAAAASAISFPEEKGIKPLGNQGSRECHLVMRSDQVETSEEKA